jgi:hypothetical protein
MTMTQSQSDKSLPDQVIDRLLLSLVNHPDFPSAVQDKLKELVSTGKFSTSTEIVTVLKTEQIHETT